MPSIRWKGCGLRLIQATKIDKVCLLVWAYLLVSSVQILFLAEPGNTGSENLLVFLARDVLRQVRPLPL